MTYQPILDEVEHLHSVSGRLEGLADQHPRATEELLTIAGSVRRVAPLLAVLVTTKLKGKDGQLDRCAIFLGVSNERFNEVQAEINLKMEKLKATKNPALRRDLLAALRLLLTELDKLTAKSINELQ